MLSREPTLSFFFYHFTKIDIIFKIYDERFSFDLYFYIKKSSFFSYLFCLLEVKNGHRLSLPLSHIDFIKFLRQTFSSEFIGFQHKMKNNQSVKKVNLIFLFLKKIYTCTKFAIKDILPFLKRRTIRIDWNSNENSDKSKIFLSFI